MNLKMYDTSDVLYLSIKSGRTTETAADTCNNEDIIETTVIYEVPAQLSGITGPAIEKEDLSVGRGKYFPTCVFQGMEPEVVDNIPDDINGKNWYRVQTSTESWAEDTRDGYYYLMRTSSREGFQGKRKIGYCHRSMVCPNPNCAFMSTPCENQPELILEHREDTGKKFAKSVTTMQFLMLVEPESGIFTFY